MREGMRIRGEDKGIRREKAARGGEK